MKRIRFILILLAILPFARAHAQTGEIIYRDFEPDSILVYWLYLGPIYIDLDVDGEADDLMMRMTEWGNVCHPELFRENPNLTICYVEEDPDDYIISEVQEKDWRTYVSWSGGNTAAEYSHYGFRIKQGDDYYYGWFETYNGYVEKDNGKSTEAHYGFDRTAYCTIPNYPLRWGQTELYDNVSENGTPDFATVLPNPNNGVFTVVGENLRQIEVLDVLGQRIATLQAAGDRTDIDLSSQPAGVYLINVNDKEGKSYSDKVVKQ